MPKVSVLVPVYNVEKYLPQCLDSIIQQTMCDIEVICVNDGSTDRSGEILDSYALKESRIKIIHKKNAGYGAAMNDALRLATGEYIGIVESDDKIVSDMYEVLYAAAREHDLDFVKSEAYYWYETIGYLKRVHEGSLDRYFDKVLEDVDRNVFFDFFMNIWTGIYKREFLINNHIAFHESSGASYQDNAFWMQTCLYAKKAMWLNKAFYYYRQDNPEASVRSSSKMLAMTKEYEYLEKVLINRKHDELLPYCYSMKMFRLRGTFFRIADENKMDFLEQVKSDYSRYKGYIRYNKYVDSWLREFLDKPQIMCETIATKKTEIIRRIANADGIIIYGIGKRGDRVLRTLYNEGLYDKISCFAVSELSDKEKLATKEILGIEAAVKRFPKALVLVAVVKETEAYTSMLSRLEMLGVQEYMDTTDIEENFYVL